MPRPNLAAALTRALKSQGIPFERTRLDVGATLVDFVLPAPTPTQMRAHVLGDELVVFQLLPGFAVPPDRVEEVSAWAEEVNLHLFAGTITLDREDGEIAFRHTIDCTAVPKPALEAVLAAGWELTHAIWRDHAPGLLPILAGAYDFDDESEWSDQAERLLEIMQAAIAERFGGELAEALDGALGNVAESYLERVVESVAGEVDVGAAVDGDDAEATLTLSAPGVRSLRFRFSPAKVREREAADARGLVLYHHATADGAQRILASGFLDEPQRMSTNYDLDAHGVMTGEEATEIDAVLLTDAPLPPDDRVGRPVMLRITWGEDAPSLGQYLWDEIRYSADEACVVEQAMRRWRVPAEVLNDAVRDGVAALVRLPG